MKELQQHVDKLADLLNDPHPGLFSWFEMVKSEVEWITNFGISKGIKA